MDPTGYLFIVFLVCLLVVCWIILPFAIIGTKPLLRELLREQKRTNELLAGRLRAAPQAGRPEPDRK